MTHRDGLPRFSARRVPGGHGGCPPGYINAGGAPATPGRGDAGHREAGVTLSESLGKPPLRSPLRPVGGRRKALTMFRIACDFPPTRRAAWTIPIGHYHRSLVSGARGSRLSSAGLWRSIPGTQKPGLV